MNKRFVFLAICLVFFVTNSVSGCFQSSVAKADSPDHTYFISPSGDDSNDGSINNPWKSLSHAGYILDAGDTLYFREGTYYGDDAFYPSNSGLPTQPITIKAYNSEVPIIKLKGLYGNLFDLSGKNYFTFEGLSFIDAGYATTNAPGGINCIFAFSSTGLNIRNCIFKNTDVVPPKTDPRNNGGFILLYKCSYVVIENCDLDGTGTGLIGSGAGQNESIGFAGGHHFLIQNNHVGNSGHSAIGFGTNAYIYMPYREMSSMELTDVYVQNNVIENHWGGGIYFGGKRNVVQNNTIYYCGEQVEYGKGGIYAAAPENIIRNNLVVKTSAVSTAIDNGIILYAYFDFWSLTTNDCLNNRVYNNVVYHCGNSAVKFGEAAAAKLEGNVLKNNIFYSNNIGYPARTTEINFETTWTSDRNQEWVTKFPFGNNAFSNIILNSPSKIGQPVMWFHFMQGKEWRKTIDQLQSDYPASFSNNIEADPLFVNVGSDNPGSDNFRLQANSPAIDAGSHLTKTIVTGSNTTELQVEDATYFTSGGGLITGDCIQIGNNPIVRVMSINYNSNIITLSNPVTYNTGDYVDLPYSGNSPDIGAYEFGPVATQPPIPTPTQFNPGIGSRVMVDFDNKNFGTGLNQFTYTNGTATVLFGKSTDNWTIHGADNLFINRGPSDASASFKFQGTIIKLFGEKTPYSGTAGITIFDEEGNIEIPETMVDFYSLVPNYSALVYTSPMLQTGIHTIKIRVSDTVNKNNLTTYDGNNPPANPYWMIDLVKAEVFWWDGISTMTPSPTPTPTPTLKPTPTPTRTPRPSKTPKPTVTPSGTPTPTPTVTLTGTPAPTPTKLTFTDLEGFEWAVKYIESLASTGIINGYPGGIFKPENNITRGEFAKVITSAFNIIDDSAITTFSDVAPEQWYYKYIASLEKNNLTKGNGDGTFTPDSDITREEMFAFNARAMNKYMSTSILGDNDEETISILAAFSDGNIVSDWARGYIATNIKLGIVQGSPVEGGMALQPNNAIIRAEVAVVVDKTMKIKP